VGRFRSCARSGGRAAVIGGDKIVSAQLRGGPASVCAGGQLTKAKSRLTEKLGREGFSGGKTGSLEGQFDGNPRRRCHRRASNSARQGRDRGSWLQFWAQEEGITKERCPVRLWSCGARVVFSGMTRRTRITASSLRGHFGLRVAASFLALGHPSREDSHDAPSVPACFLVWIVRCELFSYPVNYSFVFTHAIL